MSGNGNRKTIGDLLAAAVLGMYIPRIMCLSPTPYLQYEVAFWLVAAKSNQHLVNTNQSDSSLGDMNDGSRSHYSGKAVPSGLPGSFLLVQSLHEHLGERACGLPHFLFRPQMPRCARLAKRIPADRRAPGNAGESPHSLRFVVVGSTPGLHLTGIFDI